MGRVHAGDDHDIGLGLGDHLVELVGEIGGQRRRIKLLGEALIIPIHARLAEVAQPYHDGRGAVIPTDGVDIHAGASACADQGVRIYVDAVINHMTGPQEGSSTGSAGTTWEQYEYPDLFGDGEASYTYDDFGPCYDTIENWDDKEEVQNCELLDLADLDTGSSHVQDQIVRYLNEMIELGVGGFRVDATKHIPEEHVEAIFAQLDDVPGWGGQPHVYHEVIGDDTVPIEGKCPFRHKDMS